jgi:hypothetical protein
MLARVILVAQGMRDFKERKDTDAGRPILIFYGRSPGAHARRFLSLASRTSRAASEVALLRRTARSPSKAGGPVLLPDGRVTRRLSSSTRAGFAAHGSRQDAVCKSLPGRGSVSPTPQAPLPARTARNRPDDALGGREREGYGIYS